ncbi:MAG: hypothetical protein AABZ92_05910, partial [Verrucomicrobiota bacterium]
MLYAQTLHGVFYHQTNTSEEVKRLLPLEKLLNLLRNREENTEEIFPHISIPDIRYREEARFKRDAVLTWVFNQSIQKNPGRIVATAEGLSNKI